MRQLKPLTIVALGAILTGTAMTVPFFIVEHGARNFRSIAIGFSVGAAFGIIMFAPIAFALKFRVAIRGWLERHAWRVQPWFAFVMALALGYLIASWRHRTFDAVAFVAIGLICIGALFGVVIGVANDPPAK